MFINEFGEKIIYNSSKTEEFLTMRLAGVTNRNPDYRITHNTNKQTNYGYYVFEYVISGKGYIENESERILVQTGDSYFLNKSKKCIYYSDKEDPYEKIFIVIKGAFPDALARAFNIEETSIVKKINTHHLLTAIHKLLEEEHLNYDKISVLILKLFQKMNKKEYESEKRSVNLAEQVKNYLDSSVTQKMTLDKISIALNISKPHIERIFKMQYYVSPMEYFAIQKTEYACKLLATTYQPINVIAEQLGFCNAKYMARCVKNQTGLTPSEYRKKAQA